MRQTLIAIDQTVNTLFYETTSGVKIWGFADESISARSYRLRNVGWPWQYRAIDLLFFWQDSHCKSAYVSEQIRSQLPKEYLHD